MSVEALKDKATTLVGIVIYDGRVFGKVDEETQRISAEAIGAYAKAAGIGLVEATLALTPRANELVRQVLGDVDCS